MTLKKRLSQAESRIAAVEAARALLLEAGPQAVTLKAVAGRVGRTHANLLHHFGTVGGLHQALASHLASSICATIADAVIASRAGIGSPREVVDLIFDAFDREGAAKLASWVMHSGDARALDSIVDAIHDMVDDLHERGSEVVRDVTLNLVLLALGDAIMGAPLAASLGLPRSTARDQAEAMLVEAAERMAGAA